jgi:hypothetical protein
VFGSEKVFPKLDIKRIINVPRQAYLGKVSNQVQD